MKNPVVYEVSEFNIELIAMVILLPATKVFVLIKLRLIALFDVTAQTADEFILEGLFRAEIVLIHAPLAIDNWFGRIISIRLLLIKSLNKLKENVYEALVDTVYVSGKILTSMRLLGDMLIENDWEAI